MAELEYDELEWVLLSGGGIDDFPTGYTPEEFVLKPQPPALIPQLIPHGLTTWVGPSGTGKTFVAMDAALSLATGGYWLEKPCAQINVAYFLAEGEGDFAARLAAWCYARGVKESELTRRLWIIPDRLPLESPERLEEMVRLFKIGLVVIDTWNMTYAGDEDNNSQVGNTVKVINLVQNRNPGLSTWIIHHTGHADGKRGRGASALFAAVNGDILVGGTLDEDQPYVTLHWNKFRSGRKPLPVRLNGHDVLNSLALEEKPIPLEVSKPKKVPTEEQVYMALLSGAATQSELEGATKLSQATVSRALVKLQEKHRIAPVSTTKPIRYQRCQK